MIVKRDVREAKYLCLVKSCGIIKTEKGEAWILKEKIS